MIENTTSILDLGNKLTSRDIDLVQSAWAGPRQKLPETGVTFFKIFFKNHPEYRQMFSFKDVPDEEWIGNETFLSHSNRSFESLSSMIDSIGNPILLNSILTNIREFHEKRNIKEKQFIDLKESLIEASFILFDGEEDKIEVFKKAISIVTDIILQGFNDVKP